MLAGGLVSSTGTGKESQQRAWYEISGILAMEEVSELVATK